MKLFTTKEAAAFLKVDRKTIQRYRQAGILVPDQFGANNTVLYSEMALLQACRSLLSKIDSSGDLHLKFHPQVATCYEAILESFTKKTLEGFGDDVEVQVEKFHFNTNVTKLITLNDKLTKTLFSLPADEYYDSLQNGTSIAVNETISRGKKIQSYFTLKSGSFAALRRPLNEFDRAVFDTCNSARAAKFIGITPDSLLRALVGGKNKNTRLSPNQSAAIFESLERLMTIIEIDFSQTCEKIPKYNSAPGKMTAQILPCQILENVLVNGQITTIIEFTDESPLLKIARAKKQLLTYPVSLLNIPRQNNTPLVIMIKSYVIRRVLEIIAHNMTPTITFADVFKHCELSDANRLQQYDARKIILDVMKHLQSDGIIKSFETTKKDGSYYSISLTF